MISKKKIVSGVRKRWSELDRSHTQQLVAAIGKSKLLQVVFEEWLIHLQLKQDGTSFSVFCTEFVTSQDEKDRKEMMQFCISVNLLSWTNFWALVRPKLKPRLRRIGVMPGVDEFYETLRMSIRDFMVRLWEAFVDKMKKKQSGARKRRIVSYKKG